MKVLKTRILKEVTPARLDAYKKEMGLSEVDLGSEIEVDVRFEYELEKHERLGRLLHSDEWTLSSKSRVIEILPSGHEVELHMGFDDMYENFWSDVFENEGEDSRGCEIDRAMMRKEE